MPTTDLPGNGATMRRLVALSARARSLSRLTMRATFTPGAGSNSYIVTIGPGCTSVTFPSIPKLSRARVNTSDRALSASSVIRSSGPEKSLSSSCGSGSSYPLETALVTTISGASSSDATGSSAALAGSSAGTGAGGASAASALPLLSGNGGTDRGRLILTGLGLVFFTGSSRADHSDSAGRMAATVSVSGFHQPGTRRHSSVSDIGVASNSETRSPASMMMWAPVLAK